MNDINTLEELGLLEVSRKTHIEVEYLQYMIDKDFEKLNRVNTLGFVKILSREYQIDLTSWVNEFEAYWNENRKTDKKEIYFANKNTSRDPDTKRRKIPIFPFLIIIILIYLGWHFNIVDYLKKINFSEKNETTQYSSMAVVEEAEDNLKVLEEEAQNEVVIEHQEVNESQITEQNYNIYEELNEQNLSEDQNLTFDEQINQDEQDETIDKNQTNNPEKNLDQEPKEELKEELDDLEKEVINLIPDNFEFSGKIIPKGQLWLGITYLDTGRKKSILSKNTISLDLTRDQLILTGHGELKLVAKDDSTKDFVSKNRLRFVIEQGKIKQIGPEEFSQINKGKKTW